jgi:carboxymethylenebutenolidase
VRAMRLAILLSLAVVGCSSSKPVAKAPPAMHPTGVMSEAEFKALHDLRADEPPPRHGKELTVGGARAYLSVPAGKTAPMPGIVLIHEWWGLNANIEHWADRLAALGYATLAVDLYGGEVATTPDEAMALMGAVDEPTANAVIAAAIDHLAEDPAILAPKRAVMGWCFGGGWSLEAALDHPELDAAIMYYGMPETDVMRLRTLEPALLGIFANRDGHITPQVVDELEAALAEAGKPAEIHRYDADHAFANPSNPGYDEANAAAAWAEVVEFLRAHLGEV